MMTPRELGIHIVNADEDRTLRHLIRRKSEPPSGEAWTEVPIPLEHYRLLYADLDALPARDEATGEAIDPKADTVYIRGRWRREGLAWVPVRWEAMLPIKSETVLKLYANVLPPRAGRFGSNPDRGTPA